MPTRRTVLAGASLLTLSGCLSRASGTTETPTAEPTATPTATPNPTDVPSDLPSEGPGDGAGGTRPRGTGGPAAVLAGTDDQPDLPLSADVTVTDGVATEEHPPLLSVSLTNTGDDTVAVGEARSAVFEYVTSESGYLTLLPADGEYDADPGCWRLDLPVATTMEYRTATLAPGESLTSDLALYAAGVEADACLPVGEHRFETTMSRYTDPDDPDTGEQSVDWGFSLLLE
mgnify:CR=1 FL=1